MSHQTHLRLAVGMVLLLFAGSWSPAEEPASEVLSVDSFENGKNSPDGWKQGNAVRGVKYIYDHTQGSAGKRSLCLQKSERRYFPIAGWMRVFPHNSEQTALKVATKVKAERATKAIIDIRFFDANDEQVAHKWAAYIGQKELNDPLVTHDWKLYEATVEIPPKTKQIGIAFQIYGPGKVWFDELDARYVIADASTGNRSKTSRRPEGVNVAPSPVTINTPSGTQTKYLFCSPDSGTPRPSTGHPLLVVLPGGDGSARFHPFVEHIHKTTLDGQFAIAQLLAPPQIVWPTKSSVARRDATEDAVRAVINDVADRHSIDRTQVYALAWSSSGPAAYATFLQEQSPLAGAFIAMSVFRTEWLTIPTRCAPGRGIYLLHSPEDMTCPFEMAKDAEKQLSAAGARVKLVTYAGGHGWHGAIDQQIRTGMQWLQQR